MSSKHSEELSSLSNPDRHTSLGGSLSSYLQHILVKEVAVLYCIQLGVSECSLGVQLKTQKEIHSLGTVPATAENGCMPPYLTCTSGACEE